jgi:beta-lactamase regulating signal transducer with metallopeptidase domain
MMAALINHLWQSTLFALAAGLLTLVLRRNRPGVRYGLWFAASVKFLIPFAVLTAASGFAADRLHVSLPAPKSLQAIAPVVEPFTPAPASTHAIPAPAAPPTTRAVVPQATLPAGHAPAARFDPAPILLGVWALGLAAVLLIWTARWSRIRQALRAAAPTRLPAPVPVLATPFPVEPGVIGLWRPWVIVPEGVGEQLTPAEWKAVLDHELCHIRRRDNLTGAIHMLVQALFWFHPLVWWLGDRLVAEREKACDEAVVRGGSDALAYARTILKVCRLYVRQPLVCAAGASGSSLVARVETILNGPPSSPLSPAQKALLLAAGASAITAPLAAGLIASPAARQAVARAAAITSDALDALQPVAARSVSPDQLQAAKTVALARTRSLRGPALTLSGLDHTPVRLTQTVAAPQFRPVTTPAPSVQIASASTTSTPATAAAAAATLPAEPADPKRQALEFVRSYARFDPKHTLLARWAQPLCIQVVGLAADQEAAVRARIGEVAAGVGLGVKPAQCASNDVEVGFTADPQSLLDDVAKRHRALLGDRATAARTITQPIQAWYVANGLDLTHDPVPGNWGAEGFRNVLIIVDLRRAGTERLGVIADYVAMLALSQPGAPDHCQALPSITDLFAGPCPGRAPPAALTPADAAYLTALYSDPPKLSLLWRDQSRIGLIGSSDGYGLTERMADILAKAARTADASGAGQNAAQPRG